MKLVDIGANLTSKQFRGDLDAVIARACDAGVARMIVTGLSLDVSRQAQALAASRPGTLWCTAGVHPHNAKSLARESLPQLRELCRDDRVVAVGECGLDFNRNFSPPEQQRRAFEWQLELAVEVQKPVFLHERDAHAEFLAMLRGAAPRLRGMVVHCFTGTRAQAEAYLDLGAHLGITGWICDERRGRHLAEVVRNVPPDRLLVETDAPFLLPRDLRLDPPPRRNEPAFLPHVARAVARAAGLDPEELALRCWDNAARLFQLDG